MSAPLHGSVGVAVPFDDSARIRKSERETVCGQAKNCREDAIREPLNVMNREELILEIRSRFRQLESPVSEFQRRNWAAMESIKLGRGGLTLVSQALRISPNTIKRGIQEIESGQAEIYLQENSRIRKPGGGRKVRKDEQV